MKTENSSRDMLHWQYKTLLGQVDQVTLHASDDSCPCNQVAMDPPEYCLGKHLLSISTLAAETALMDEPNRDMLEGLSSEASEYHEKAKEIYCKGGTWPDLEQWSRAWRKKIEPVYYACDRRKAKVHDAALEDVVRDIIEYKPGKPPVFMVESQEFGIIPPEFERFKVDLNLIRSKDWNPSDTPSIIGPSSAQPFFRRMRKAEREWLLIICLDTQLRLTGLFEQAIGTRHEAAVDPHELARIAIMTASSNLMLAHNHPSGDPKPSPSDIATYKKVKDALHVIGINVVDFIVVGQKEDWSVQGNVGVNAYIEAQPQLLDAQLEDGVRVSGSCKPDRACSFRVTSSRKTERQTGTIQGLPQTIDEVIRASVEQGIGASDRTFAYGTSGLIRYDFRFRIVDGTKLIVSNDPFTFAPNPSYPAELQPRRRERKSPQLQVKTIAQNLNPDSLLVDFRSTDRGAPIIGRDMVVESGNGRTMALLLAAKEVPERFAEYKDTLRRIAPAYNLDPADVDRFEIPVLTRERLTDTDRKTFAEDCNAPIALEQSAIEKARTDAEKVTPTMLKSIEVSEGESVEDALRTLRNKPFVVAFLGKLPSTEQARLVDANGILNQDGVRRATLAIFVATFSSDIGLRLAEQFFESTDVNVKNCLNGIAGSLGLLSQAESMAATGQREPDYAIGDDLAKAVSIFSRIKKTPGMTVAKYMAQIPLQERELTPFQETILQTLDEHSRSGKRIAGILSSYAQRVIDSPPLTQGSFMPGVKATKAELFQSAVRSVVVLSDVIDHLNELRDITSTLARNFEKCNISEGELDKVLSWRPLRDFVALVIGLKKPVSLCNIGVTPGFYQLTIRDVDEAEEGGQITTKSKAVPYMKRIYTPLRERVYEISVPESEGRELTWAPQEIIHVPRPAQGMQPAMFDAEALGRKIPTYLREQETIMEDGVKISGKCETEAEDCQFRVTQVGKSTTGEGMTGLKKAIEAATGSPADMSVSLPVLAKAKILPLVSEGQQNSKPLPKAIIFFKSTIEKHYRATDDMHKNSIRTIKEDGALVLMGCPKGVGWDPPKFCGKQEVIMTIVPNTKKYRDEVKHLLEVHPELEKTIAHREKKTGVEPKLSDTDEEEWQAIAVALKNVEEVPL